MTPFPSHSGYVPNETSWRLSSAGHSTQESPRAHPFRLQSRHSENPLPSLVTNDANLWCPMGHMQRSTGRGVPLPVVAVFFFPLLRQEWVGQIAEEYVGRCERWMSGCLKCDLISCFAFCAWCCNVALRQERPFWRARVEKAAGPPPAGCSHSANQNCGGNVGQGIFIRSFTFDPAT